jgi:hypothetical protein
MRSSASSKGTSDEPLSPWKVSVTDQRAHQLEQAADVVLAQTADGPQLCEQQLVRQTPGLDPTPQPPPTGNPQQPTQAVDSWLQLVPVLSTKMIPVSAARSSTGQGPGWR